MRSTKCQIPRGGVNACGCIEQVVLAHSATGRVDERAQISRWCAVSVRAQIGGDHVVDGKLYVLLSCSHWHSRVDAEHRGGVRIDRYSGVSNPNASRIVFVSLRM